MASIEDEEFLDRLQRGVEVFAKGDLLRCNVKIAQTRDSPKVYTPNTGYLEVLERLPRAVQLRIGEELPPERPPPDALPPGEEVA